MSKSKKRDYSIPQFAFSELSEITSKAGAEQIFDMHCHLDMTVRHFEKVREEAKEKNAEIPAPISVADLVQQSADAGVSGFLHCGCCVDDVRNISNVLDEIENASTFEKALTCFGAAAIHPNEAVLHAAGKGGQKELLQVAADGLEPPRLSHTHLELNLEEAIAEVEAVCKNDSRVRVIGETGLDYFRSNPAAFETQQLSFREHINLANNLSLPLQIHDREAHEDVVKILKEGKTPERVLFHSFSGDIELAKVCKDNGWFMSFSGPVTFNANSTLREAFLFAWENAPDLILTETDCPFLTPHPFRSRTNAPSLISQTLLFLSTHFEIPLEKLASQIAKNEKNIFT